MMRKSTNKELVEELKAINKDGRLDIIIANAMSNRYHDYKNPTDVICGKTEFVHDAYEFPELEELRQRVIDGEFDEEADEDDKAEMRKYTPRSLWKSLGL